MEVELHSCMRISRIGHVRIKDPLYIFRTWLGKLQSIFLRLVNEQFYGNIVTGHRNPALQTD